MTRTRKTLLSLTFGIALTLALAGLAPAQDADGDGVTDALDQCPGTPPGHTSEPNGCSDDDLDGVFGHVDNCPDDYNPGQEDSDQDWVGDECDICPHTDPEWDPIADYPWWEQGGQVSPEGCADRDRDDVADWRDDCPSTTGYRYEYLTDERGCLETKWVHVRTSTMATGAGFGGPFSGEFVPGSLDFVMKCGVGPTTGLAHTLFFGDERTHYHANKHNVVWFVAHDNGDVELWSQGDVDAANAARGQYGAEIYGASYYYDPCDYPTDPCQTETYGMTDPDLDGITVTIWLVPDSDNDDVVDENDLCPGTAPYIAVDANGCPLPDGDGDGVLDLYPDYDNDGLPDDYSDLCPDSDANFPVDPDGCLDTDRDGVPDTADDCPNSPLGATMSIEGCYDADGDGVGIRYDDCPQTPGGNPVNSDGCTDTDGDGVPDTDDLCPDPCSWVNEDGCPDTDQDGVADGDDLCPATLPQTPICPDGCTDDDDDSDGVPNCLDICDDPCTWVDDNGCPDSDRDKIADVNDLCADTDASSEVVGRHGCGTKDVYIETDGPLMGVELENPFVQNFPISRKPDESGPEGSHAHRIMFSEIPGTNPGARLWFRVYRDGTTGIWDTQDLAYWHRQRRRPGGDPLRGMREGQFPDVVPDAYGGFFDSQGYEVSKFYHTMPAGVAAFPGTEPWYHPEINIFIIADEDADKDGVRDPVDECLDSNLLEHDVNKFGCPAWPKCDDRFRPSPRTDIDTDCYVDENDLIAMSEQWLQCVHPLDEGCVQLQPSPEEMYPDIMYMHYCGPDGRTVDGSLGDWSDPCWVDLDQIYWSDDMTWPNDLPSAQYTVCWDPCDDLFYAAVQVVDTDHVFETAPTNWHTSDRVEIYVQADPNGGDKWGSNASGQYDKAQQYIIGYQGIIQGWTWAVFGHGTYLPGDFEPFNAHFTDAGRISGDTITYEISAKAWQWYGGITPAVDPNVVRQLEPGVQVGFDVVADSRWGTSPHDDAEEFGMLSANLDTGKYIFADRFQRWELLDYDGVKVPPECGDWGYLTADVNPIPDCYVDMTDFEQLSSQWMDCTDPCSPCNFLL